MTQIQEEPVIIDIPSDYEEEQVEPVQQINWNHFYLLSSSACTQISPQILYMGNLSDCWELLGTKMKGLQQVLGDSHKIIVETIRIGRIYFLELCKKSINPKENGQFRKKVKKLLGQMKDNWLEELNYSVKQVLSSGLFELMIRKHKMFEESVARKQIIKITYEVNFTQPNKHKILTYLWLSLQYIRKRLFESSKSPQPSLEGHIILLIIGICYPSYTSLIFSQIKINGNILELMWKENGGTGVKERLENMGKKEMEGLVNIYNGKMQQS